MDFYSWKMDNKKATSFWLVAFGCLVCLNILFYGLYVQIGNLVDCSYVE